VKRDVQVASPASIDLIKLIPHVKGKTNRSTSNNRPNLSSPTKAPVKKIIKLNIRLVSALTRFRTKANPARMGTSHFRA
jgi:hypothetical protein